jgi:hypothetical protein
VKIENEWVKVGKEKSVGLFEIIKIPKWLQNMLEEKWNTN